jgi:hypothetical protein
MTNFFSSIYCTIILFLLCVVGLVACFVLAADIVAISSILAVSGDVVNVTGDFVASAFNADSGVACASALGGWQGLNFHNLERHSENIEDYADQHNPALLVELAKKMNAQADRLENLFLEIETNPKSEQFGYEMILPWRQRADYMRSIGQAKAARELEKREAAKEAKRLDSDEEFQAGYKEFLANEFESLTD